MKKEKTQDSGRNSFDYCHINARADNVYSIRFELSIGLPFFDHLNVEDSH